MASCADTLRKRLGCLPFAKFTESRTFDLPKAGDPYRFAPADFWYCSGIGGTCGSCESCTWSDSAKKDRAFIQSEWRSALTAVNFSARDGVRIRIDLWKADVSSGRLGNAVSSATSITDWIFTVRELAAILMQVLLA